MRRTGQGYPMQRKQFDTSQDALSSFQPRSAPFNAFQRDNRVALIKMYSEAGSFSQHSQCCARSMQGCTTMEVVDFPEVTAA